jgi:hypothetical protein
MKIHMERSRRGSRVNPLCGNGTHSPQTNNPEEVTCRSCLRMMSAIVNGVHVSASNAGAGAVMGDDAYRENDLDRALAWIAEHGAFEMCEQTRATREHFLQVYRNHEFTGKFPVDKKWVDGWIDRVVGTLIAECVRGHEGASAVLREFRALIGASFELNEDAWRDGVLNSVRGNGMPDSRPECGCEEPAAVADARQEREARIRRRRELARELDRITREIAAAVREEARELLLNHFTEAVCSYNNSPRGRGRGQRDLHSSSCSYNISKNIGESWGDIKVVSFSGEADKAFNDLAQDGLIFTDRDGNVRVRGQAVPEYCTEPPPY